MAINLADKWSLHQVNHFQKLFKLIWAGSRLKSLVQIVELFQLKLASFLKSFLINFFLLFQLFSLVCPFLFCSLFLLCHFIIIQTHQLLLNIKLVCVHEIIATHCHDGIVFKNNMPCITMHLYGCARGGFLLCWTLSHHQMKKGKWSLQLVVPFKLNTPFIL